MNKMQMAHDYFMKHVNVDQYKRVDDEELISWSFDYVDAMQAEADKREDKTRPQVLEEWQPDWSQAPDDYNYWVATADHSGKISGGWFYDVEPEIGVSDGVSIYYSNSNNAILTESFNYQGNWQESLRKRPQ